jgi:hypothetical protein
MLFLPIEVSAKSLVNLKAGTVTIIVLETKSHASSVKALFRSKRGSLIIGK